MAHRNYGPQAFPVAADFDANRKIGDLVRINESGAITNKKGQDDLLFLPLVEDVQVESTCQEPTKVAGVQTHAIAVVSIETAAGITAGVELGIGTVGWGAVAHTTGFKLGIALATPAGDGDQIPVLLVPTNGPTIY